MSAPERKICQARVKSRVFGEVPCCNYARAERYGLVVCNVHKRMIDRLALGHGNEYGLTIARYEWKRPEAAWPRVRAEALALERGD